MTPRQRAGLIGAAKQFQRFSWANYRDIEMIYRPSLTDPRLFPHEIRWAISNLIHMQHDHARNSRKARELLWRILDA